MLKKRRTDKNSFFTPSTDGNHLYRNPDELFDPFDILALQIETLWEKTEDARK